MSTVSPFTRKVPLLNSMDVLLYNELTNEWILLNEDLMNATYKNIFDLDLPVIPLKNLIYYKKILAREVDLIDIHQIETKIAANLE